MKLSRTKIARLLKTGNQSRKKRDNKKRRQSLFSKDELILLPTNRKARSATNKPSKPFNLRYKTMKRQRMSGGAPLSEKITAIFKKTKYEKAIIDAKKIIEKLEDLYKKLEELIYGGVGLLENVKNRLEQKYDQATQNELSSKLDIINQTANSIRGTYNVKIEVMNRFINTNTDKYDKKKAEEVETYINKIKDEIKKDEKDTDGLYKTIDTVADILKNKDILKSQQILIKAVEDLKQAAAATAAASTAAGVVGAAPLSDQVKTFLQNVLYGELYYLIDVGSIGRLFTFLQSPAAKTAGIDLLPGMNPAITGGGGEKEGGLEPTEGDDTDDEDDNTENRGVVGGNPLLEGGFGGRKFKPNMTEYDNSPKDFLTILTNNEETYTVKAGDKQGKNFRSKELNEFIAASTATTDPATIIKVKLQFRNLLKYKLAYTEPPENPRLLMLQNLNVLKKSEWFFNHINVEDYARSFVPRFFQGVNWKTKDQEGFDKLLTDHTQDKYDATKNDLKTLIDSYRKYTIAGNMNDTSTEGKLFKKIAEVIKPSSSAFSNAMLEDVYFIEKRLRQLAGLKKQGQDETKIDENAQIQVAIFDTFNKNTIEILPLRDLVKKSDAVGDFLKTGNKTFGIGEGETSNILFEIIRYITQQIVPLASKVQKSVESKAEAAKTALENAVKTIALDYYNTATEKMVVAAQTIKDYAENEENAAALSPEIAAEAKNTGLIGGAGKFDSEIGDEIRKIEDEIKKFDKVNNEFNAPLDDLAVASGGIYADINEDKSALKPWVEETQTKLQNLDIKLKKDALTSALALLKNAKGNVPTAAPAGAPTIPTDLLETDLSLKPAPASTSTDTNDQVKNVLTAIAKLDTEIANERTNLTGKETQLESLQAGQDTKASKIAKLDEELATLNAQASAAQASAPAQAPADIQALITAKEAEINAAQTAPATVAATPADQQAIDTATNEIKDIKDKIAKYEKTREDLIQRQTPNVQALLKNNIQFAAEDLLAKAEALKTAVATAIGLAPAAAAAQAKAEAAEAAKAAKAEAQKNLARLGQQQQRQGLGGVPAAVDEKVLEEIVARYMKKRESLASIDAILRDPDESGQIIDVKVKVPKNQLFSTSMNTGTGVENWMRGANDDLSQQAIKQILQGLMETFQGSQKVATTFIEKILALDKSWKAYLNEAKTPSAVPAPPPGAAAPNAVPPPSDMAKQFKQDYEVLKAAITEYETQVEEVKKQLAIQNGGASLIDKYSSTTQPTYNSVDMQKLSREINDFDATTQDNKDKLNKIKDFLEKQTDDKTWYRKNVITTISKKTDAVALVAAPQAVTQAVPENVSVVAPASAPAAALALNYPPPNPKGECLLVKKKIETDKMEDDIKNIKNINDYISYDSIINKLVASPNVPYDKAKICLDNIMKLNNINIPAQPAQPAAPPPPPPPPNSPAAPSPSNSPPSPSNAAAGSQNTASSSNQPPASPSPSGSLKVSTTQAVITKTVADEKDKLVEMANKLLQDCGPDYTKAGGVTQGGGAKTQAELNAELDKATAELDNATDEVKAAIQARIDAIQAEIAELDTKAPQEPTAKVFPSPDAAVPDAAVPDAAETGTAETGPAETDTALPGQLNEPTVAAGTALETQLKGVVDNAQKNVEAVLGPLTGDAAAQTAAAAGGAKHKKRKTTRRRHSRSSKKHKRSRHKRSRHKRK